MYSQDWSAHESGNDFAMFLPPQHRLRHVSKIYLNLYKIWAIRLTAHPFPIFGLHYVINSCCHSSKHTSSIKFKIANISPHSFGLSEFWVISEEFCLNVGYRLCINLQKLGRFPFPVAFTKHFVKQYLFWFLTKWSAIFFSFKHSASMNIYKNIFVFVTHIYLKWNSNNKSQNSW